MRRALAVLAALCACAFAPPAAIAAWGDPQLVGTEGWDHSYGNTEMTSDGDVIATWSETEHGSGDPPRTMMGVWPADGAPAKWAVDGDEHDITLTTDGSGDATAWYERSGDFGFHWRERPAGGSFGASETYPLPAAGGKPDARAVAENDNGDAALMWRQGTKLLVALRPKGGDFGAPEELADLAEDGVYPRLFLTNSGELVVVWLSQTADEGFRVRALHRSASGAVSDIQTLSTPEMSSGVDSAVTDDAGDVVLVWHETNGVGGPATYRVARRTAGGPFAELPLGEQSAEPPRAAITGGGIVTLAVTPSDWSRNTRIYSGRADGPIELLQTVRWKPNKLVANADQTLLIGSPDWYSSVSSMRTGEGKFGPAEDVARCGVSGVWDVELTDDGRRVVVWSEGWTSPTLWLARGGPGWGVAACVFGDDYQPDPPPPPTTNPPPDGPAASGGSWLPGEDTWGLGPQPEVPLAALEVKTLKLTGSGAQRRIGLSATCGELCYAFGTAHVIGPNGRSLMKKTFYGGDARDGNLSIDWELELNAKARRRLADGARAFKVRLHMRFGDVWNRRVARTYEVRSKPFMSRSKRR